MLRGHSCGPLNAVGAVSFFSGFMDKTPLVARVFHLLGCGMYLILAQTDQRNLFILAFFLPNKKHHNDSTGGHTAPV